MQIPKFKDFFVEQDIERKDKPITVAVITKSNPNVKKQKAGQILKKNVLFLSYKRRVKKKDLNVLLLIQNTLLSQVKTKKKIH